ncbi:hypothetical protein SCP_0211560 [Sparassis crispa]|uniref:Uncharacterized protein n=1 Tax=Sparassis crispa TaxID=139825 RepID=A0A401GCQ0_9APHY|nr:hypothetical protein SCP_0211560 [Sparassis crispa]GBE79954.1 hypothetical protein SCP_0211560 [Sparassis crispa]
MDPVAPSLVWSDSKSVPMEIVSRERRSSSLVRATDSSPEFDRGASRYNIGPYCDVECTATPSTAKGKVDKLPFLGPPDPSYSPPEKWLFLAGFLFFPLWIIGGFWRWREQYDSFAELFRWRCQVMTMLVFVITIGLIFVEVIFRGK